jgi:hypothetical protein
MDHGVIDVYQHWGLESGILLILLKTLALWSEQKIRLEVELVTRWMHKCQTAFSSIETTMSTCTC